MADGNFGFKVNGFDSYILRLGEQLRGERATMGKSLIQVQKDLKIKVARNSINDNSKIQLIQNTNEIKDKKIISGTEIKSPIIGTAYLAPEPGGKKFIEIGKREILNMLVLLLVFFLYVCM